ncbi:hypothetical protein PR048_012805 [Dryococelus australis]|uniref:Uncharacterized protein n=1 Tax=Dryococelus australis TaxID=614101 RepID=A0ABQ9HQE8_9NEOP|nr:hypothetical protein PR048_012805 [Dryococelus australis]
MTTGRGHAQLEHSMHHDFITDGWKQTAQEEMAIAAKEETEEAIKMGDVDVDRVPILTIVADGAGRRDPTIKNTNPCQEW